MKIFFLSNNSEWSFEMKLKFFYEKVDRGRFWSGIFEEKKSTGFVSHKSLFVERWIEGSSGALEGWGTPTGRGHEDEVDVELPGEVEPLRREMSDARWRRIHLTGSRMSEGVDGGGHDREENFPKREESSRWRWRRRVLEQIGTIQFGKRTLQID